MIERLRGGRLIGGATGGGPRGRTGGLGDDMIDYRARYNSSYAHNE